MICNANQLTGFCMKRTLVANGLKGPEREFSSLYDEQIYSSNPFHATCLFLYLLKTSGFLMFSGGVEREQWHKMA